AQVAARERRDQTERGAAALRLLLQPLRRETRDRHVEAEPVAEEQPQRHQDAVTRLGDLEELEELVHPPLSPPSPVSSVFFVFGFAGFAFADLASGFAS